MADQPAERVYPEPLERLLGMFREQITAAWGSLELGDLDLDAWQREMEAMLSRYGLAAYMAGQDSPLIGVTESGHVYPFVQRQLAFLDNFALVIASSAEFQRGWQARAESYAKSIVAPYWKGRTKVLPLPAMPGDMTTPCGQNCACGWDVVTVDEDRGDYDCFWLLNAMRVVKENCQVCQQRAEEWRPLQIREGRVVIPAGTLKEHVLEALDPGIRPNTGLEHRHAQA